MARMRFLRPSVFALLLAALAALPVLLDPVDARASVSIAITFDTLVKDADAVGVATPVESKSVWEGGRIYTYTRMQIEQGVAGELGTGAEGWVRTMGGVVGNVGQAVDGEAVFTTGKSSLLFLRKFKSGGTWEVSARAQGQYPVLIDDSQHVRKVIRSSTVGVLLPPRRTVAASATGKVGPQSLATTVDAKSLRLAGEVLHERPFDDVAREVAAAWKKLHPPTPSDAKK